MVHCMIRANTVERREGKVRKHSEHCSAMRHDWDCLPKQGRDLHNVWHLSPMIEGFHELLSFGRTYGRRYHEVKYGSVGPWLQNPYQVVRFMAG